MSVISDHDWGELAHRFKNAKPFPSICIDNFLVPEFADRVAASYPQYHKAQTKGREFHSLNERKKIQITDPAHFPDPVVQLSEAISTPEFLQHLVDMTGIEDLIWDPKFSGGGMHLTASSGILDVHVDFNFEEKLSLYRRINILIYLNPVWDPAWGGAVELWDREIKNCIHSFEPFHNRCVIFATSDFSYHGVTAVKTPAHISRNSFAVYYYAKEAGDNAGEAHGSNHTTIFKARPEERVKKYLSMPLRSLQLTVQKQDRRLRDGIKKLIGRA